MDKHHAVWPEKTILIAEDEPINFMLLNKVLEVTQARVLCAKNGQEAVDFVNNHHPDLVLMDIRMPIMNGIEAVGLIRKTHPHLPIFALTAFTLSNELQECKKAGCNEFITKPIIPRIILDTIDAYFSK